MLCLDRMGIVRCSRHGTSGIAAVCPHIKENVGNDVKTNFCCEIETRFDDEMPLLSWIICRNCLEEFRKMGLPENNLLQGDDDFLETWQTILEERGFMQSVVCGKCLSENLAK
jgi:hypothetical protein